MTTEDRLRVLVESDPGDPAFADYATLLIEQERVSDAIWVCLKGLSRNPEFHRGRLLLAQAFFRAGFLPFAAREVQLLCSQLPENELLLNLYQRLAPNGEGPVNHVQDGDEESEVAEVEFDVDLFGDGDEK